MRVEYPKLPFDNQHWLTRRQQAQKPWHKDEFWAFYVTRRISIYLSWWLAQKTNVTPNLLTVAGILCGLAAAASYMAGTSGTVLLGCILYQLAYLLDCVDGEVARMKGLFTPSGIWLDFGLNYSLYFSFFAIVYGLFRHALEGLVLYIALFAIFCEILATDASALAFPQAKVTEQSVLLRKKSKWLDGLVFLFLTVTGFQFGAILCSLIWLVAGENRPMLIWTLYHLLIALLRSLYKIRLNLLYLKSSREAVAGGGCECDET